jgi:CHAT domain-containing protein
MSQGDYARAEPFFLDFQKVEQERFGAAHPFAPVAGPLALAGMYMHQGSQPDKVRKHTREALDQGERVFAQNAAGQNDQARIAYLCRRFFFLSGLLSAGVQEDAPPELYRDVLALRGAASACLAADRLAHDHPDLRPLIEKVREARRGLTRLAYDRRAQADRAAWLREMDSACDAKEDLETKLALATRHYLKPEKPIGVKDLQSVLPEGTVLIDFLQYDHYQAPPGHRGRLVRERRLVAFVVRREDNPKCVPLGASAKIEEAVSSWREAVAGGGRGFKAGQPKLLPDPRPQAPPRNAGEVVARARAVADLVWRKLAPQVGNARMVLLAPDGPLCYLSFAALPGRKPGTFQIEDHAIGYVPFGRFAHDLVKAGRGAPRSGMLAVGGIQYPGKDYLPGTKTEADLILKLFNKVHGRDETELLTGPRADAGTFLTLLQRKWRYVHFAGHGFFADPAVNPNPFRTETGRSAARYTMTDAERQAFGRNQLLLSGLVLTPTRSAEGSRDGILTAEEVGSVDLRGTEMVTLSACETGLGASAGGEGVLGLQRAFLTAGARSVVTSLWRVDDAATVVLMRQFYQNLWGKKMTRLEALRQAQLDLLRNPRRVAEVRREMAERGELVQSKRLPDPLPEATRCHPAYWAAFVLSGDGR